VIIENDDVIGMEVLDGILAV